MDHDARLARITALFELLIELAPHDPAAVRGLLWLFDQLDTESPGA